ncbi:MAG: site-specific DNA-methyltransferase [Lachnospiraceae bacterium]|jgi:DNA modification methylase|nr:site-specific DNA-methyltransferase [Lachnospiraceae bacterium]
MIESYEIKPYTQAGKIPANRINNLYPLEMVLPVVGMNEYFVKKILGRHECLTEDMVVELLEQDAFSETFVPRSMVLQYLRKKLLTSSQNTASLISELDRLYKGDAISLIDRLKDQSIQCVVTSTPYWAMRIYDEFFIREWADGETCAFGLEQTPEGFIRHSVETLYHLQRKLTPAGSLWWNIMDSYNTRTQIRNNASEALYAMQGHDKKTWKDHKYKRYSAGHSYLQDGEQCLIPQRIAERASRIGFYVKSMISWCKTASMPEPQQSRVSRNVEYILHLTVQRTPLFHKQAYLSLPADLGGKQDFESEKLSDFWHLPTSAGGNGHGAQFPLQLPGRCIALSTNEEDTVLDPFMGSGTTAMASVILNRHYIGFDISDKYIQLAARRIENSISNPQRKTE